MGTKSAAITVIVWPSSATVMKFSTEVLMRRRRYFLPAVNVWVNRVPAEPSGLTFMPLSR